MKKLLSISGIGLLALLFAAIPVSCSTDPIALEDQHEEVISETRASAALFIRQYKISFKTYRDAGSLPLRIYMASGQIMPFDTAIWYKLRITLIDGTYEEFNIVPTIYQGTNISSQIILPKDIPADQVSSLSMLNPVIVMPADW